jgi:large subunit ribosomal protein L23
MALLDFLKNKKNAEKAREGKRAEKKPVEKTEKILTEENKGDKPNKSAKRILKGKSFAFESVKQPHISEKATFLSEQNQYIFEISPNCNKNEVKKSIEGIYNVDVLSVNIVKIPAKKRRLGKTQGWRKAYVKAIVRIKEGQKIEIL